MYAVVFLVAAAHLPCWQANCEVMQNITVTLESLSYHELHDSCRLILMKPHRVLRDLRMICLSLEATGRATATRRMLSLLQTVKGKGLGTLRETLNCGTGPRGES